MRYYTLLEILYPTEEVNYDIQIPQDRLPYVDIKVEGSVSRRHLFRFSQTIADLEQWTRPILVETFRSLNAIDVSTPISHAVRAIPEFGAKTTLEEVAQFRQAISESIPQFQQIMKSLNKVFHSAPNQEIRDYLKETVGHYITSGEKICNSALASLSSGDSKLMCEAAESLRQHLSLAEEVSRKKLYLMSRFGIDPAEL